MLTVLTVLLNVLPVLTVLTTTCMHTTQYTSGAPHAVWGIVSKWAALYLRNNYQNNVRRGREKCSNWSNQQRGALIDCLLLLLLLN